MDTPLKYPWQQAVVDAFTELRPECQPEKIIVAERTILERLRSLRQPDIDERASLHDAFAILRVVFPSTEREDKPNMDNKDAA
jgi:hypothetical protein